MRLGIDFGTTNSAIALSDGQDVHVFHVDAETGDYLPSLIYVSRRYRELAGTLARSTYLEKNTNRPSRLVPVYVGETEVVVGGAGGSPIIYTQPLYVTEDELSPGRLIKSIKTGLRDASYEGTNIFGRDYSIEALITIVLRQLIELASQQLGEPVRSVVMGRPVRFSEDPAVDQRAEEMLRRAGERVGLEEIEFMPEPIGAAYIYHHDLASPRRTLIFDFGGGTLDLTVARLGGHETPELLATEGVLIGGDDFDRRIMAYLLPYFGEGVLLRGGKPFPPHILEQLLDWQSALQLNQPESMRWIDEASTPGSSSNPEAIRRLKTLVTRNLTYPLLQEIERAKKELSRARSTVIHFEVENIWIRETLTNQRFEMLIRKEIAQIEEAIDRVLAQAGLAPEQIELVVRTGGTSELPAFVKLLERKFGAEKMMSRQERVLTGVVQGLGAFAYHRDRATGDTTRERSATLQRLREHEPLLPTAEQPAAEGLHLVAIRDDGRLYCEPWPEEAAEPPSLEAPLVGGLLWQASEILLATSQSRFVLAYLADCVEATADEAQGWSYLQLKGKERYTVALPWATIREAERAVLLTESGHLRAYDASLVDKRLQNEGQWQIPPTQQQGAPVAMVGAGRDSELMVLTRAGRMIRLGLSQLSTRGNRAIKVANKDRAIAVSVVDGNAPVVILDNRARGRQVHPDEVPRASKPGGTGQSLWRGHRAVALLPLLAQGHACGLTSAGRVVRLEMEQVSDDGKQPVTSLMAGEQLVSAWLHRSS